MSSPKSSDSISSTTSIAEGVPQPEIGPVLEIPRPPSSNSLESMKHIVPDVVKEKYRAQGYKKGGGVAISATCLLYTSPSPRDRTRSRMPSSA